MFAEQFVFTWHRSYTLLRHLRRLMRSCLSPPLSPSSSEHSQSEYVLFQAGSTIREAVLREWAILPAEEKDALRAYLLHYLTSNPG